MYISTVEPCNKLIEQKNSARIGAIHLNSVSIAFK